MVLFTVGKLVLVREGERAIVQKNGRLHAVLRPGRYRFNALAADVEVETHSLKTPGFASPLVHDADLCRRPPLSEHLTHVVTGPDEVAVVCRDGRLYHVQGPDERMVFWTDAGPWQIDQIKIGEDLRVPAELTQRLMARSVAAVRRETIDPGQVGLLFVNNVLVGQLEPGSYAFWNGVRDIKVKLVDVREHVLDIAGQDMLTKDRVTLRVTLSAQYRVVDPVAAVTQVKDFADSLYRALQMALRHSLTTRTLDELLANRVTIDSADAESVRQQMAAIGIEVGEIAIKDVILPGEMRDILNRVVGAQKEAEANAIRRREETAATRSLLNTARVIEENPIMLRLKELEALERMIERVDSLVIHNGTQGLLQDLVTLGTKGGGVPPGDG